MQLDVLEQLDALEQAIDEVVSSDPESCADLESVERLQRQASRLEAYATRATGAMEVEGQWATSGARTAAAWQAWACHQSSPVAKRSVRRSRHLRQLRVLEEAWSEGWLTGAHVDAIIAVRNPRTEAALERDEELLVAQAKKLSFETFVRALAYWVQLADPEGTEESAEERRSRRDAYFVQSMGGMYLGKQTLDEIGGAIVARTLDLIEQEFYGDDYAEAKERLGRDPHPHELARTPGHRTADAVVEMAVRARTAPADGRRPEPLFTVLVDYQTLLGRICQLEGGAGAVVTPDSVLRWLTSASFERIVFTPGKRAEVSVTARFFSGATRRAIEVRDQECQHPTCHEPVERCQVDHIVPWNLGGPTNQENAQLLCAFHNRQKGGRLPPDHDLPEDDPPDELQNDDPPDELQEE